jgi:gamma-glutamyltranspeptidase/glutathione hydrolase
MNNEMDDFAIKPNHANIFGAIGSENNSISPFKTPLSSMSPTIVFKNNLPYLTLGSPSGTRILTCVANTIINFTKYKMPLFESVATIRFHHQWTPDEIRVDSPGFPPEINKSLLSFGYKINIKDLGCKVQAILHDHDIFEGVSDPRGFGRARGR